MNNIFFTNLSNFLEENKNEYLNILLKENKKYKILYDSLYSNLKILSKKLPEDDNSLDNLFSIFSEISQIESSFFYLQGLKDYKKLKDFMEL
ncbi:MAG: hypothetical protein ACI4UE_03270 [Candidatus Scatovivens sp.]